MKKQPQRETPPTAHFSTEETQMIAFSKGMTPANDIRDKIFKQCAMKKK